MPYALDRHQSLCQSIIYPNILLYTERSIVAKIVTMKERLNHICSIKQKTNTKIQTIAEDKIFN